MRPNYAFLCDYAQQDPSGKINALGIGWANLAVAELPATHAQMTLVASLSGSKAEAGAKKVEVHCIDADGANVIPALEADLDFAVQEPALEGNLNLVFNLQSLQFKKYGQYAFHLIVQGNEIARVPFSVVAPPSTS